QNTYCALFKLGVFQRFLSLAVCCVVSFFISIISGWHRLSKRFRAESEPYGVTKSAGPFPYTVYTRYMTHYSFIIRMTAAEDALYLSVVLIMRIGHPPLRIPWKEIQLSKTTYFMRPLILLTLGVQERIPMRISASMAGKLGILERIPASS
ncbi:MAG: hypothetical protein ACLPM3_09285, partial [Terracidiphilus sp.]